MMNKKTFDGAELQKYQKLYWAMIIVILGLVC